MGTTTEASKAHAVLETVNNIYEQNRKIEHTLLRHMVEIGDIPQSLRDTHDMLRDSLAALQKLGLYLREEYLKANATKEPEATPPSKHLTVKRNPTVAPAEAFTPAPAPTAPTPGIPAAVRRELPALPEAPYKPVSQKSYEEANALEEAPKPKQRYKYEEFLRELEGKDEANTAATAAQMVQDKQRAVQAAQSAQRASQAPSQASYAGLPSPVVPGAPLPQEQEPELPAAELSAKPPMRLQVPRPPSAYERLMSEVKSPLLKIFAAAPWLENGTGVETVGSTNFRSWYHNHEVNPSDFERTVRLPQGWYGRATRGGVETPRCVVIRLKMCMLIWNFNFGEDDLLVFDVTPGAPEESEKANAFKPVKACPTSVLRRVLEELQQSFGVSAL